MKSNENSQPEAYLEALLSYLACPIDPTSPLTALRNGAGQVVSLRSAQGEYPVIHNIPCLLPTQAQDSERNRTLWQAHQEEMWQNYQQGDPGVFANSNEVTDYIGELLDQKGDGLFLDLGCGALPQPCYMAASEDHVHWLGIDPFFGDQQRQFPFAQAVGEYLPFRANVLDGVLYASTLSHQIDPQRSLRRVRQALKPQGRVYIWYEPPKERIRYTLWRIKKALGIPCRYNRWHHSAFTQKSLRALLRQAGFILEEEILLCTRCPDYGTKCQEPGEFLAIARSLPL